MTPAMASAEVLGGYGYVPENSQAEKGFNSFSSTSSGDLDMTIYRTLGWLLMIWVPLVRTMTDDLCAFTDCQCFL